jgi:hypothetical protein
MPGGNTNQHDESEEPHATVEQHPLLQEKVGEPNIGASEKLFVSQRNQWIDFRCATRGNVTRQQGDDSQYPNHTYIRQRISGGYFEQQRAHQARQRKCACQTDHRADE